MKSVATIIKSFMVAVVASTLLTGCIKDKYDEPEQLPDVDPNLEVNFTIEQLKDLYKTEPVEITEDYIISGTVISDDQQGNVYQTLIIQDATGGVGFRIQRPDLFTDFPFGRKVYVNLKGLWVGSYNNLIQIGAGDDGRGSVTLIPAAFADDYFVKGPRNQTVTPIEIAITDLSNKYQNMLIKLKNVQFVSNEAGTATYADAVRQQAANTTLEDCAGNKIIIRSSGYSKFAGTVVPSGKGEVVAIYQIFGTTNQLLLNKVEDVQLFETVRCDGTEVEDPNIPVNMTIEELKELYKSNAVQITEDYVISGTVISDDEAGNVYQTLIIQDETGGVGIRIFKSDLYRDYPYASKVYVKLKGLWIGAYNNLIQVGGEADGSGGVRAIEPANVGSYIFKGPRNQPLIPREISIQDLSSRYQNTLIKLKDVQFVAAEAGKATYADAVRQQAANTNLENCTGNKILVRTSGYSKFAGTVVPSGRGDVVAIYQIFGTTNQLLLNKVQDVQLNNPERCSGTGPVEPTAPSTPGTGARSLFIGADFEDFNAFLNNLSFPIRAYAAKVDGQGVNGSAALAIKTETIGTQNQAVITPKASSDFILSGSATKISFYVKGSSGKSLALYVYKSDGTSFHIFNVGDLTTHKIVSSSATANYTGTINTNGEWALVTLDLDGLTDLNRSGLGDVFSLRVGHSVPYDLLIDNIVAW